MVVFSGWGVVKVAAFATFVTQATACVLPASSVKVWKLMQLNGSQFRTDVLTGQQVIVAPQRSGRPAAHLPDPPLNQAIDPFVEGQEHETPAERYAVRTAESRPDGPGWQLRIVPNRYPAVVPEEAEVETATSIHTDSLFPAWPARGEHDVVIECPDRRTRLVELTTDEIQQTLIAWRIRFKQLTNSAEIRSVAVFRNEGFSAGASLAHCHSQIVATSELMPLDVARHDRAALHRMATGRDLVQDMWNAERMQQRLICATDHFGVYCPFASHTSWQMRFTPVQTEAASFADSSVSMLQGLAVLLKSSLIALEQVLGGPFSFNLTLAHPRIDQPAAFSWYLDLLPRTGRTAGWELLTNVDIVTVPPEVAAQRIREAMF